MLKQQEYKIIYDNWKTDEGDIIEDFYVKKKICFIGINVWVYCKHTIHTGIDVFTERLSFHTEEEAMKFIKKMKKQLPTKYEKII